jgi:hypothetical protein
VRPNRRALECKRAAARAAAERAEAEVLTRRRHRSEAAGVSCGQWSSVDPRTVQRSSMIPAMLTERALRPARDVDGVDNLASTQRQNRKTRHRGALSRHRTTAERH